jgi:sodium/proline symporter
MESATPSRRGQGQFLGFQGGAGDRATFLPPIALSAQAARDFTRETLDEWHLSLALDGVVLVVDELVTNAVRHGAGPITLVLTHTADIVHVQVSDDSSDIPVERRPRNGHLGGRGLAIVAALARSWGTRLHAVGGKTVWADLAAYPRR